MKALNVIAMILLIVGAINWGLVGLLQFDLVRAIFGGEVGTVSSISAIVYILVGLAGLYGLYLLGPILKGTDRDHTHR